MTGSSSGTRDRVRMTPDELRELLDGRQTMSMATLKRSGRPHLVAMWYGFVDGSLVLWTYARSQKVVNIRRDPRVTCLIEEGETYPELRGAELLCTGEVVDDPAYVMDAGRSVYERYMGVLDADGIEQVTKMSAKRVAVRLKIEQAVTWDHRKLHVGD